MCLKPLPVTVGVSFYTYPQMIQLKTISTNSIKLHKRTKHDNGVAFCRLTNLASGVSYEAPILLFNYERWSEASIIPPAECPEGMYKVEIGWNNLGEDFEVETFKGYIKATAQAHSEVEYTTPDDDTTDYIYVN